MIHVFSKTYPIPKQFTSNNGIEDLQMKRIKFDYMRKILKCYGNEKRNDTTSKQIVRSGGTKVADKMYVGNSIFVQG